MKYTREANKNEMIAYIEKLTKENAVLRELIIEDESKQLNIAVVSNNAVAVCDEWIHKERVKVNDDTYCPICGTYLKAN
jgi:predicted GIY-YIG superfamily endonuclease